MPECQDIITSEEYGDFIWEIAENPEIIRQKYSEYCPQLIYYRYVCAYERLDRIREIGLRNYSYSSIPKLFGLMDTTAVAATGAIRLQNQTGFELTGRDVIVGFIDTGIDYTNSIFKNSTGQTRILEIWDQSDSSGNIPDGFDYGSLYTAVDINRALGDTNPYSVVPHRDENGHGTIMAGVACGGYDRQRDFVGSAPDASIAVVKLKPAKQYLRDYFFIKDGVDAYQENDIMLAVLYLMDLRMRYNRPLVIVLGVGTGNGSRTGGSPLAQLLGKMGQIIGNCVVVCSGNEANARLHYQGRLGDGMSEDVEFRVGADTKGFALELWGNTPDVFSVSLISPLGESIPRIPARKNYGQTVNFLLDGTTVEVDYRLVESGTGEELVFLRFINPSEGIWVIRVYGNNILNGAYNIWGNLNQFTENIFFLKPEPEGTLTVPSSAQNIITVGGFDNQSNSIYPPSGRGFTRDNRIKPDIVAPAVSVYAPNTTGGFTGKSGTSIGAALTAGCCAQMLQWGYVQGNEPYMRTNYIKNYLIRGAKRERDVEYPSPIWGYGEINVYNSFLIITRT